LIPTNNIVVSVVAAGIAALAIGVIAIAAWISKRKE